MTTANTTDPGKLAAPPLALWQALRDATLEVLSPMLGTAVSLPQLGDGPAVVPEGADSKVTTFVTGMIGIAGPMRAILSLRCSEGAATKIAAQMLGISSEEAAEQKADAIGEICNMVASHFKNLIGLGNDCVLSVPTVVGGGRYSVHCVEDGQGLEFAAVYQGETVLVTLDIRNTRDPSSLRPARS